MWTRFPSIFHPFHFHCLGFPYPGDSSSDMESISCGVEMEFMGVARIYFAKENMLKYLY